MDSGLGLSTSASRIEAAFERVNATLAAQQEQLSSLQAELARRPSVDEFDSLRGAVASSLRALESRVTAIEHATRMPATPAATASWKSESPTAPDLPTPTTPAEAVMNLAQRVAAIETAATGLATQESLTAGIREANQHADIQIAALDDEKATKTAFSA